jgi:hypothetical protein
MFNPMPQSQGAEAVSLTKPIEVQQRQETGLLRSVLCQIGIPERTLAEGPKEPAVPGEQRSQRASVPIPRLANQFLIAPAVPCALSERPVDSRRGGVWGYPDPGKPIE